MYVSFAEQKHVQDIKEEMEDIAICEPSDGIDGGPEAGKRPSAKMGADSKQSTGSKRARVTGEVGKALIYSSTTREQCTAGMSCAG